MGELLWKKHYKYWKLYYVDGCSFFAYKDAKAYVRDRELRLLAIIKYRTYPDVDRLEPCDEFETLQKLGLINIRWTDSMGHPSRYCYFDITWEPFTQIPPLIIARTLIDGLGWRAFSYSIKETWEEYLNRFDITTCIWNATKKALKDVSTEELPEFLTHDCPAISTVASDVITTRYAKSAYRV